MPSADELREGGTRIDRVRDIQPEDVLGREPVKLDEHAVSGLISGRAVMVTGAGGSIGAELCRQIARFGPSRLVLFELSEFALYQAEQDLGERFPHLPLVRLVGDVKDLGALRRAMATHQPDLVFHAAAYKHVPLMEDDNAWIALRNNTLGTYLAAQAAAEAGVQRFVLISTDKAVNPTNVMGATKRAAEMVLSHWAARAPGTRFTAVRFGNVLGSSGSVIPKFKEQIARGGPVTVTHPDIIRYFMTIPEAARLVLQAAAIGDSGQVLVLDMGEPVKIVDLARDLIRLAGHAPEEIAIEFTGLRAGEKLYEELLADADDLDGLAAHGRVERDAVAEADTHGLERAGAVVDRDLELGERARAAVLGAVGIGLVVQRDLAAVAVAHVAVHTVVGDIDLAAREPLCPRKSARVVLHLRVGREPFDAHVLHGGIPERGGVAHGFRMQLILRRTPLRPHEAREVGIASPRMIVRMPEVVWGTHFFNHGLHGWHG